ncbi:MarR family winged helix-turn-helix transcriptional regulator [Sphingomonas sp. Root241]|uniref:MarR family winged helix-turn-helix transcriptional regulator n=1 Tax=Sphingomonas sp. Root241 TaxID=1736501 RepID=UPI0006F7AEE8|nr:MarR family transcriptional regulator [Sphingomonas sp. Root241]KRC82906.1 MarR family transcriptional regulator [Sphingomonas sp. Root241]
MLTDEDYAALADFRHALRQFLAFSEARAAESGLTPQQHQALLAIRGAGNRPVSIGYIADRLILKPHSATGLLNRLESLGLVVREASQQDRRQALLRLTPAAQAVLEQLSATHREEVVRLRPMLETLIDRVR